MSQAVLLEEFERRRTSVPIGRHLECWLEQPNVLGADLRHISR